jgi:hypothetical protein
MDRSNNLENTSALPLNTGRWNQEEHKKFLRGCIIHENCWGKVIFNIYYPLMFK